MATNGSIAKGNAERLKTNNPSLNITAQPCSMTQITTADDLFNLADFSYRKYQNRWIQNDQFAEI